MKKPLKILIILLMNCLSTIVFANNNLQNQLNVCKQIQNDEDRLSCFDQIDSDKTSMQATATHISQKVSTMPAFIADLDEPNLFISYGNLDFLGDNVRAVLLGGGKRQSVRSFKLNDLRPINLNVFGQIRSQFDVSELDTRNNRGGALINTDFSVGGELVQSLENWNWRLSYSHHSTHLGDEFIIDNQNYLQDRINLSYETVKWTAHKELSQWDVYGSVGLITRSEPGNLDKVMWQLGWQYKGDYWHGVKPIWAVDLKTWGAFDWNINVNMRAGIEIDSWTDQPFQLLFEYQDGHSPYGQFYQEDLTFTGLTFLQNW